MRAIQVRTSTVKTISFRTNHPDETSLFLSVIRVVLAAGTEWKFFLIFGVFFI